MKQSRETYDVQTLKSHETGIVLEMRNAAGGFSALPTKAGCVDRPSPKLFWEGQVLKLSLTGKSRSARHLTLV